MGHLTCERQRNLPADRFLTRPSPSNEAPHAARTAFANVACVIDTLVPLAPVDVATLASSCCASALMMPVPRPDFPWPNTPSGLPTPLSDTDSFQSVPAIS